MNILITGGAGFIGTHVAVELLTNGHTITVVDSLVNSKQEGLRRVEKITGKTIPFFEFDVRNTEKLDQLLVNNIFDAVIHLASLKAVDTSVVEPLMYYGNNLDSTVILLTAMKKHGVKKFIFSSSATVYGIPEELPLVETSRTGFGITNPYGQTKFMIEQVLRDVSVADDSMEITILRFFNPIGAHESGLIGEDPHNTPDNLVPYISQVAVGKLDKVRVFGDNYNTSDGTGVRDYIHVVDIAKGHVAALAHSEPGIRTYNLATGRAVSVLELLAAYSKAAGKQIPYTVVKRRPGDIDSSYASPAKANKELGWFANKTIEDACEDAWRWQSQNPQGFDNQ